MEENNPRIIEHTNSGGLACIAENGYITICKGTWRIRVDKIVNIPLTYRGKALFMIQNILPVVLAGFIQGFKISFWKIAAENYFGFAAIENISHNNIIIDNIILNTKPLVISPTAYFFYNFAYPTFLPNKALIIN